MPSHFSVESLDGMRPCAVGLATKRLLREAAEGFIGSIGGDAEGGVKVREGRLSSCDRPPDQLRGVFGNVPAAEAHAYPIEKVPLSCPS